MSKHNKEARAVARGIGWKQNAPAETVLRMAMIFVGVILTTIVVGVNLVAAPVAAATGGNGDWPLEVFTPLWAVLMLIGAIALLWGLFAKEGSLTKRQRTFAILVGAILLIVALAPLLVVWGGGGPDREIIIPPDNDKWDFEVIPSVDNTDGGSYPGGVFSDCDTVFTAGNTPEWQAAEGVRDLAQTIPKLTSLHTIDTTLSRSNEDFNDPNCILISHSVDLKNGVDNDGDGTNDAVQYTARVVSVSITSRKASNDTGNYDVIYQDSDNRWYIGFQDDGSDWVGAYDVSEDFPSGSSDPIVIGDHNGGSADTVHFFVMITDYGAFNYDTLVNWEIEIIYEIAGDQFRWIGNANSVS